MSDKLTAGNTFPTLSLSIVGGGRLTLPDDIETPLAIVLFYRSNWRPFCRRLLAGYEERREAFQEQGLSIFAGSVDEEEQTAEVAASLGFPLAFGVTPNQANAMGAWWEDRGNHIQPSEFVLSQSGRVLMSTYSNSPNGPG